MEDLRLLVVAISAGRSALRSAQLIRDSGRDELAAISKPPPFGSLPRICQQIVKFMSFYIPKYVINLISGYSLGV
jgi:hypothetical protein